MHEGRAEHTFAERTDRVLKEIYRLSGVEWLWGWRGGNAFVLLFLLPAVCILSLHFRYIILISSWLRTGHNFSARIYSEIEKRTSHFL